MVKSENDETDKELIVDIEVRAITIFGSVTKAWEWMNEPNTQFDGRSAREMLRTDLGRQLVESALDQLEQQAQNEKNLTRKGK